MRKRVTRWLLSVLTIMALLSSTIGVLAADMPQTAEVETEVETEAESREEVIPEDQEEADSEEEEESVVDEENVQIINQLSTLNVDVPVVLSENATPDAAATVKETKQVTVTSSYSMFKLKADGEDRQTTEGTVDIYTDGSMKLKFVYEGKSFKKMYLGKAADAVESSSYEATLLDSGYYQYEIPITSLNKTITIDAAVLSSKGKWQDNTLTITEIVTATLKETKQVTVTSSYSMFKLKADGEDRQTTEGTVDIYTDGSMKLKFVYEGKSFKKMYLGKAADAVESSSYEATLLDSGYYQYEIPITSLNTTIDAAVLSSKGKWQDNTLTITEIKTGDSDKEPEETPEDNTTPGNNTSDVTAILPSGTYSVSVETGAAMFKVTACNIVVKNQTIKAIITLSGTGYDCLYVGSGTAAVADFSAWSYYSENASGQYQYVLSIPYNDFVAGNSIQVAAHSVKSGSWYNRTLTFDLTSLAVVSASTEVDGSISAGSNSSSSNNSSSNGNNNAAGNNNSAGNTNTTLSGAQITNKLNSVDKNATVKDGTYVPEFGFTGGSGRATISCRKVVVKNGKATATIVFSSPNYTWVRSLGTTVYNQNKGGNSTYTIPINLNGKTPITAETTAMSQPYTVEYTLYCFIDGTKVTTSNTSTAAEKTKDTIELETASAEKTEDTEESFNEESGWGSFYEEKETAAEMEHENVPNQKPLVTVLLIALVLVCIYAAAATIYVITKLRKRKGE